MSDKLFSHTNYPCNLLLEIKGQTDLKLPERISPDIQSGLYYALSLLTDTEQALLRLYYAEDKTAAETASALEFTLEEFEAHKTAVFKKLRRPSRWNYIQYGIAGYLENETANQYSRGFLAGYAAGYHTSMEDNRNGRSLPPIEDDILNLPIEALKLSARACHVLHRKKDTRIRDVVALDADEILRMRNLGSKTADEIARALQAAGVPIAHTAWYQYLI